MDERQNALAPQKDPETGRFLPGNSGFGGRPVGARNKLGEAFVAALQADFDEHGVGAIQRVRDEKPDQYLKVIASLLPKDVNFNFNNEIEMSDDELCERIRALGETIAPFLADRTGTIDQRVEAEGSKAIAPRVH